MFIVAEYCNDSLISFDGLVHNESEFNRHIENKYKGKLDLNNKVLNHYGDLSIHYHFENDLFVLAMIKIEEVGQPEY